MKIKERLKENNFLRRIVKKIKIKKEYKIDAKNFCKFYMDSQDGVNQIEYKILFISHSLEKGMTYKNIRPFGEKKVQDIIDCLNKYLKLTNNKESTAYKVGVSAIVEWKKIYDNNNFEKGNVYKYVSAFIDKNNIENKMCDIGAFEYDNSTYSKYKNFDYLDAISTRHSTRDYENKKISEEDLKYCIKSALLSPSACNRQMCKIYSIKDEKKAKILASQVKGFTGFNIESAQLFLITYDISAFLFYGERNQGYFNAGLFAMNFVNAMHFKGIGSCFLQWSNPYNIEKSIKDLLSIPKNEKIVIVIAAGYYKNNTLVPKSCRKKINEIYSKT